MVKWQVKAARQVSISLSAEQSQRLAALARERGVAMNQLTRLGVEVFLLVLDYIEAGQTLTFEDPTTGRRAELVIPGFRARPAPSAPAVDEA